MRQIPFGRPIIKDQEKNAVREVLDGHILVHGPRAAQFENEFKAFTGSRHAVSVANCTAAMHLAYFYWGLGPGDEVVVPAQTHVATAHAVELTGAKPVFADADPATGNVDPAAVEAAVTARTRAIAVVHFLGTPVDMDAILAIAAKHGLHVLEDCALAVGTRYKGTHAGNLGHAGCFSFYPVKHMTTAEGGMLVTNDESMARRIERQRAFGVDRTVGERSIPGVYDVTMLGFNYRMSEIAAALGVEQVKRLDGFLAARRKNFNVLASSLREMPEFDILGADVPEGQSSYYCLSALLKGPLAEKRFELIAFLKQAGIGTSCYYPRPVPHMSYYREKYGLDEASFPAAARISYTSVALPVGPHLDEEDMRYIVETMRQAVQAVRQAKG